MSNPWPWWLTWPVAEVAARILPLFSSAGPVSEDNVIKAIVGWCKTGEYRTPGSSFSSSRWIRKFQDPDFGAVGEALQVLEHAGLLMKGGGEDPYLGLTRLGMHALETSTVRQHLGLSGAPPTP